MAKELGVRRWLTGGVGPEPPLQPPPGGAGAFPPPVGGSFGPQRVVGHPTTRGFRIRQGNIIGAVCFPYFSGSVPQGSFHVVFDDGTEDDLLFHPTPTTTASTTFLAITGQAKKDGWILDGFFSLNTGATAKENAGYAQLLVLADVNANRVVSSLGNGYVGAYRVLTPREFTDTGFSALYAIQGTVTEDATAGTHVCSLTVTPGAGDAMQIVYGTIQVGNGAANLTDIFIDDGTNVLTRIVGINLSLAANAQVSFPFTGAGASGSNLNVSSPIILAGTERLVLKVQTATVSLTHTFSVSVLIKTGTPTVALADTVGTPTTTLNTSGVQG